MSATRRSARCGPCGTARTCLNEVDPRFADNIERHIHEAIRHDPFHVSANTDPKGDRSKRPQDQDPDMLVHVVKERDDGIVIRGAKYETAAAYSNQAFLKPTIANWGDAKLSEYAVGCHHAHGCARREAHLPHRFHRPRACQGLSAVEQVRRGRHHGDPRRRADPLGGRLVLPAHPAAAFIRTTLHRYSAFAFVQRILTYADMMIGAALWNVKQTGLDKQQAVQEKLATLACYREGINAHLTASVAMAEKSPNGLLMPNQSLLFTGRVHACSNLHHMMHWPASCAVGRSA